jgi:arsenical pump membrane protein
LAISIAFAAIVLLAVRPRPVPAWVWPVSGALLVVLLGAEPLRAAAEAVLRQWNVLLFILGLMGVSAAAQESGAFLWIADFVVDRARGSRRRLFVLLFLACAAVTIVLSNDATAIALTPIVYAAVSTRAAGEIKPFLLACVFVANTASFGLPFSNPANVLILPHAQLLTYLRYLGPPEVAAIAINLAVFLFFFGDSLKGPFPLARVSSPAPAALRTLVVLAALGVAYLVALMLEWPLGPVALAGAVFALAAAGAAPTSAMERISWRTLGLLAGLFVLFDAVMRAGFVAAMLTGLRATFGYGSLAINAIAAVGAALLSNLFNNLPVAVAASYVGRATPEHLAYPLIAGVDVGPNLLTTGSIATILWLAIVRGYGVRISLLEFARLGALVVPPTLAVTIAWLWLLSL